MSLTDQILKLSNTAPDFADSDDEFASAQVIDRAELDDDVTTGGNDVTKSSLRTKTAALLDEDLRYKGRRTSRHKLKDSQLKEDDDDLDDLDDENEDSEEESADEGEEEDEESVDDEESDTDVGMQEMNLDAARVLVEGHSDETDDSEEDEEEGNESESETEEAGEDLDIRPRTDAGKDVEKGKATRAQIGLWDSMMEIRMKLRKVQTMVNRLPRDVTDAGQDVPAARKEAEKAVQTLCDQLLFLQTCLLLQYPDTRYVVGGQAAEQQKKAKTDDDEEITSESEEEEETPRLNLTGIKRKLDAKAYPEFLAKRHKDFTQFRNSSIQKWNEKTNLASGKVKKAFGAFEQSTLKQIEQILSDKPRLIRRTQLNRSKVKVLGAEVTSDGTEIKADASQEVAHDLELFDDDDFYHQLLRDVIERKSIQSDDPIALSRQWLQMQKLRKKVKKVVDTKASKGRKIRYDVQSKLINFMAPNDTTTWTDEQRDELFKSLYGHRFAALTDR